MFMDWESLLGEPTSQDMMRWYQVQRLQERYVSVLDTGRLEEWPELFTEDCVYEMVPREKVDHVLRGGVIRCFGRSMLRDHIASLRTARACEPHTFRHITSGLEITQVDADADTIDTESNYVVVQTLADGESRVYQAGRYLDRVVRTVDGWRYQRKLAVYDTSRLQISSVSPI
jgi:anthranilate 1,2-dioxygenase small subunit